MPVKQVLRMGDARLLRHAEPVDDFGSDALHELLADMRDTLQALNGVGLAAPQIGVNLRLVIFGVPQPVAQGGQHARYPDAETVPETVLINPVIRTLDDRIEEDWEGCLSLPGLRGLVPRHRNICYHGFDEHGAPVERAAIGFHARVVQHECDHLDGILYPMRMRDMARFGYTGELFPGQGPQDE